MDLFCGFVFIDIGLFSQTWVSFDRHGSLFNRHGSLFIDMGLFS